jgi:Sec-independent protein secretion pathway component TatC
VALGSSPFDDSILNRESIQAMTAHAIRLIRRGLGVATIIAVAGYVIRAPGLAEEYGYVGLAARVGIIGLALAMYLPPIVVLTFTPLRRKEGSMKRETVELIGMAGIAALWIWAMLYISRSLSSTAGLLLTLPVLVSWGWVGVVLTKHALDRRIPPRPDRGEDE